MLTVRMKLRDIFNKQGCEPCGRFIDLLDKHLLNGAEWSIVYDYADKHIWKRHKAAWKYWHRRAL